MTVKDKILQGRTYLGIELGSTALRTAVGHILLMISTGAYKPAIKTLQKT